MRQQSAAGGGGEPPASHGNVEASLLSAILQEPECCLGKGFLGGYMAFYHLYKGVMLKLAAYAHEIVIGIVARAVYAESDARF